MKRVGYHPNEFLAQLRDCLLENFSSVKSRRIRATFLQGLAISCEDIELASVIREFSNELE